MPAITVITATFNASEHLPALVSGLRAQTFKDFEWVVADGGSTDSTLAILAEVKDLNLTVSSQPDFGIYDALNRAINLAKSDYYVVIGADDIFRPHALANNAKVQVIGQNFEETSKINQHFDVVTSFEVIEHVHDPFSFLQDIASLTNKKGLIIISSGNTNALSWRMHGAKYWYCAISEHASFINPDWCMWATPKLGLVLKETIKFSHQKSIIFTRLKELLTNTIYLVFSTFLKLLRRLGLGPDVYRNHGEMLNHPPSWMSVKDHCIYLFEKV